MPRDENFSRSVEVYGTDTVEEKRARRFGGDDAGQQLLASSVITKVELGSYQHDRTPIRLTGPSATERYRMVIRNLDLAALNVYGVSAEGEVHEAFFFCDPKHEYRLLYGAVEMEPPRSGVAEHAGQTVVSGVGVCMLGVEEKNPSVNAASKGIVQQVVTSRRLLVGAMLLMVGTLVWLIAVAASGVNRSTAE